MYERVSTKQLQTMLAFMNKHGDLSTHISNRKYTKFRWIELKEQLNSGAECKKDLLQWAKVWSDWKGRVKKKARSLMESKNITDSSGNKVIGLSSLEEKLIEFLGSSVITVNNSQLNKTNESSEIVENINEHSIGDTQTINIVTEMKTEDSAEDDFIETELINLASLEYQDDSSLQNETIFGEREQKKHYNPHINETELQQGIKIERSLQELTEMIQKVTKKQEDTNNEFDLFGKTIACQLKRLPEDLALRAMSNIQLYLVEKRLESTRNISMTINANTEQISKSKQLNEF